jgi:chromosome segregation ATPase
MTVPGKGGRPRKWRSDADRVRAFRARQRGEDEPPTVGVARAAGDEAALAWDQTRELGLTIEALKAELKATRSALRKAEKALEQERVRYRWIREDNERLRADLEAAERDRVDLQARLDEWSCGNR